MARKNNLKNTEATRFGNGLEPVENGKKGGKASVKARRKKKEIREFAKQINWSQVQDETIIKELQKLGISRREAVNAAVIAASVFRSVMSGDMKAVEKWEEYVGESERHELQNSLEEDALSKSLREFAEELESDKP